MTGLHPHQQELLQILEDPARPRFGVIESPPGAGFSRVLALYAGKVGAVSRVLVLCAMRILVDQWAQRLRADEGLRVTVLDSARSSLELLDERTLALACWSRPTRGPARDSAAERWLGLTTG